MAQEFLTYLPEVFQSLALIAFALTKARRREVIKRQDGYCGDCGAYIGNKLEIHHICPKCRGGSDHPDNLIGLCGEGFNDCHYKWDQTALKCGKRPDGRPVK